MNIKQNIIDFIFSLGFMLSYYKCSIIIKFGFGIRLIMLRQDQLFSGSCDHTLEPVSYTHLTLPTICSV